MEAPSIRKGPLYPILLLGIWVPLLTAFATDSTPQKPSNPGLITSSEIPSEFKTAVLGVLEEHQNATGEQVYLLVRPLESDVDLKILAQQVYRAWGLGDRGLAALLVLDPKNERAHLSVGFGLGTLLSNETANHILNRFILPELRAGNLSRAIGLGVNEILKALESPLLDENRIKGPLEAAGFHGPWETTLQEHHSLLWAGWMFLGILLAAASLYMSTSTQTHYTAEGWFRSSPIWLLLPRKTQETREQFSGGGIVGNY